MHRSDQAIYKEALTDDDLQQIRRLEEAGRSRGINYKIDPGLSQGIVFHQNGSLTGFMTVDSFSGVEIESAAITDNESDWDKMAGVLFNCAKHKNVKRILFICDPNDKLVAGRLDTLRLEPSFSEYRMVFDNASFSPAQISGVSLRGSVPADTGYIIGLDSESLGDGTGHLSQQDILSTRIIVRDNQPVGKLRINESDGIHGIYGVVIEKQLRGNGIGYQALTLLLHELIALSAGHVYLEVDSENPSAFHLYKKLGFKVASEFKYYPYNL